MASITTEFREVIDLLELYFIKLLDYPYKNSVLTIRQMVMTQRAKDGIKCMLISVDRNTYIKIINFSFPKKY